MSEQSGRPRLSAEEAQRLKVNLVRVAGLAACLGLLMELLIVLGGQEAASFSGLLNNGLWPFLVCMAVAIGQAVAGSWPVRTGAVSLVSTPIAFITARVIQKGMTVLTEDTVSGVDGSVVLEAVLRGMEYAVLAAALAWLAQQRWAGALAHIGFGLAIGVVFGPIIAVFVPPDSIVGWFTEELVFPAGCALIVFASETLTKLLPESSGAK